MCHSLTIIRILRQVSLYVLACEPNWVAVDRDYHFPAASGDLLTYFADYQDETELIYRLTTSEGTI